MLTLRRLREITTRGHRVTVVGPDEYHYYSGMGPGVLGGTYEPGDIRFHTKAIVAGAGGEFIRDMVESIDAGEKTVRLRSGREIGWDVLSCNAGSFVPGLDMVRDSENVFAAKPISEMARARRTISGLCRRAKITVAVAGGGPSAAEISGNIHQLCRRQGLVMPEITVYAGDNGLMSRFAGPVRRRVVKTLRSRGIDIVNRRVEAVENNLVRTRAGTRRAEVIFMATGVRPSPIFRRSGLRVGPDGGLLVNRLLQAVDRPAIFGGGDCVHFAGHPLDKVGVYAVRQNPVLFHNLSAALEGAPLQPFSPGGAYLLVFNLGCGRGVLHKRWLTMGGRLPFLIKDYIDRRFIRRFQAPAPSQG